MMNKAASVKLTDEEWRVLRKAVSQYEAFTQDEDRIATDLCNRFDNAARHDKVVITVNASKR